MNAPPIRHCPDDELLQELAAGVSSPELAEKTMQHASQCPACGPVLKRYLQEFSLAANPENEKIISQLKSSGPAWQRRLVRQLMPKRQLWFKLAPVFAAAVIALIVALQGPAWISEYKVRQAEKQVAAAFAVRRTTEARLPGTSFAPYKPFPTVLGAENGRSLDELPPSLHDASSAAPENLKSAHPDPRSLEVQGRALLWEATPASLEKAERDFEKARAEGLNTPTLEIDLAAAYFERDKNSDHPNLQRTLNLLNKVLTEPNLSIENRASALYNLALAYEKTQAWDLAASTWEQYLQVDPSSAWAEAAREHLKQAKDKVSRGRQRSYSDPAFFLRQMSEGTLRPEDPEQYQQKAFTQWLPAGLTDKSSREYQAMNALAEVFMQRGDYWWRDFLKTSAAMDFSSIHDLSDAILSNEKGRYDEALARSRHAAAVLSHQKEGPAKALADFIEVYALRSKLQGANCLARAGPALERVSGKSYRWLQAQLLLEDAQCQNFQIDLAESDHQSNSSLNIAANSSLPVEKLRVLGISAGIKHQQGECSESWSLSVAGLESYWEGSYPPERLDQFYAVMWQCARESGFLYLAEALLRHTIALREDPRTGIPQNGIRDGMLHLRLANILLALRKQELADLENRKASALLKDIDQPYTRDYVLRTKIEPAEMQLQHGDAALALATLHPVEKLLTSVQDKFIVVSFYRALGNTYRELHQPGQASAAYQSAVNIAEQSLPKTQEGPERLALLRAVDDSYRGSVRVLLDEKKPEEALQQWEWYQARPVLLPLRVAGAVREHKIPLPPQKKSSAQTSTSSAPRLIYASFADGLQIWSKVDKTVRSAWVDWDQQDFARAVREFTEHCSDPDSSLDEVQQAGKQLYARLLQPLASTLQNSQLLILELDRKAYNLPVEALTTPDGEYVGHKYSIVYSPGELAEKDLRRPAMIGRQSPFLVVDASRVPGSGHLPGLADQRKTIAELFPQATIVDSTARSWNQINQIVSNSAVFHYMGHGRADGTGTTLAYGPNHPLSAKDFSAKLFRNSQLVVLAACSTAKQKENGSWDSNSLIYVLLQAGVPQIVATRWNVDSAITSQFMIDFYQHIQQHNTVEQAVFEARKQTMASTPHPYYWAGFSIAGRIN